MKKENNWKFITDVQELQELLTFWNNVAKENDSKIEFYKEEARQSQEILGRVISQFSERWDSVQITNYPRKRLN